MVFSSDTLLRLAPGVSYQSFGEEEDGVVLSLGSGYLYSANPTAVAFLDGLAGRQTFGQIVEQFAGRYSIDSRRAQEDLCSLAQRLLEEQVLVASE